MNFSKRFQIALERHLKISRDVGKHFMKIGKGETSVIISQEVEMIDDGDAHLKTTIQLLPLRRMHNNIEIIDDDYLLFEMPEDIEI